MIFNDPFEIMAALMPLLAFLGFIIIMIIRTVLASRQKELELKARITAMENNLPVEPVLPPERSQPGAFMLPLGIIFLCTGLGLSVALAVADSGDAAVWGIMPISAGLGLIIASRLNRPTPYSTVGNIPGTTTRGGE